jgi:hypothetical protein
MTWLALSFTFHGLCIELFFPPYEFLNQTTEVPFGFVLNEVARCAGLYQPSLSSIVMRGLDPRIHRKSLLFVKAMDCRVKPGNDGGVSASTTIGIMHLATLE